MENNNEQVTIDVTYQGAKKSKLLLAKFFDFLSFLILSFIVSFLAISITVLTPGFNGILTKAQDIQINSHLYVLDEKKDEVIKLTAFLNRDENMSADTKIEKIDEALTFFYSSDEFFKDNKGVEIYNNYKKEAVYKGVNLFILDGDNYVKNVEAGIIPSVYLDFYSEILNLKATAQLQNSPMYHHLSMVATRIFVIVPISMIVLTYLVLFVLVPGLSINNHNTFGMKLCKIGAIDKTGFTVSPKKTALALTFDTFVIGLLSPFTFLIPLFISLGFMIYRDDNQNLSGYICGYYFVDISSKKVYKNADEYVRNVQYVEKHSELYDKTPLEIDTKEKSEN